ncbi:cyclic nucleotide-binding domain-containing protein [Methylobacterium sp. sgz302541]|uniref:cyclic nucleotide-binding domain-containing protein n=1 Tax=unclassified Methylobacterium TaxID=2615210 RepID=UPI003D343A09
MSWLEGINWVEAIGYLGTALTITSSAMSTMIPLRIVALVSSVVVITYGACIGSIPVMLTEAIQIPFNAVRLWQMLRLVRETEKAASGDLSLDWLKPFGTMTRFVSGQTIFIKGEPASDMYYVQSGRFRILEPGIEIGAGAIVGELGLLSPGNVRTGSLVCVEPGTALRIPYSDVKQLYYQNPEFGFYFLKLTSERLFQSAGHAPKPQGGLQAQPDAI